MEPDLVAHTADSAPRYTGCASRYYSDSLLRSNRSSRLCGSARNCQKIRLADLRATYPSATGAGVVAVIDTGVDPNHPVLKPVLLTGYDFTRNRTGADETLDVSLFSQPFVNGVQPIWMNSRSGGGGPVDCCGCRSIDCGSCGRATRHPISVTAQWWRGSSIWWRPRQDPSDQGLSKPMARVTRPTFSEASIMRCRCTPTY